MEKINGIFPSGRLLHSMAPKGAILKNTDTVLLYNESMQSPPADRETVIQVLEGE